MAARRSPLPAVSQAPFAARLLSGPVMQGISLGHGHLLFPACVLSLTEPGAPRMPNGLECALPAPETGTPVQIGNGALVFDAGTVHAGPNWDPRPRPRFAVSTHPVLPEETIFSLAGLGPGLTPLGDDVLAGYLGACALSDGATLTPQPPLPPVGEGEHRRGTCSTQPNCSLIKFPLSHRWERGLGGEGCPGDEGWQVSLANSLAARTTSLSATLLGLAARGHLPEAAHRLLEDGDPEPLLSWGASSGSGLLAGLGMYGAPVDMPTVRSIELVLPFEPPHLFRVDLHPAQEGPTLRRVGWHHE